MVSSVTSGNGFVGILSRAVQLLKKITVFYISALLVIMGLLLSVNIILRFGFNHSIPWANLIGRYAYIHIVLFGTAISYIEGSHAQIDILYQRVSKKMQMAFDVIHYVVMLLLCLIWTVVGFQHVASSWNVHPPILPTVPLGLVYLAIPLFAIVIILHLLQLFAQLKDRKRQ